MRVAVNAREQADNRRINNAQEAFRALGEAGSGAIADLEVLAASATKGEHAVLALGYIGEPAVPAVSNLVLHTDILEGYEWMYALTAVRTMQTNGTKIVPALRQNLTNNDPRVAVRAARILVELKVDRQAAVAVLTTLTNSTRADVSIPAAEALKKYRDDELSTAK